MYAVSRILHQLYLSFVLDSASYCLSRIPLVSRENVPSSAPRSVTGKHNRHSLQPSELHLRSGKYVVSPPGVTRKTSTLLTHNIRSSGHALCKRSPCAASSQDQQRVWNSTIESVVKSAPFQQPLGIFVMKLKGKASVFYQEAVMWVRVVEPLVGMCKTLASSSLPPLLQNSYQSI